MSEKNFTTEDILSQIDDLIFVPDNKEEKTEQPAAASSDDTVSELPADFTEKPTSESEQEPPAGKSKKKKKKKGDWIFTLLLIICIGVFCFSAYHLGSWLYTNYRASKVTDMAKKAADVENETVSTEGGDVIAGMDGDGEDGTLKYLDLDMDELYAINNDAVGWIRVNGTLVDYPVVQCSNNDYYLTADFEQNSNSAGCPFVDYRNNGTDVTANKNYIIYGHARKDRSMFGSLDYCRQTWWINNSSFRYIRYNTLTQKTVWKVFSVYTINVTGFNYIETDFESDEAFQSFADTVSGLSMYDFGETVTASDTIMTLSTCAYDGHDRLVVHAKLVQVENID